MAVWHGDTGYLVWGSPFLSAKWVSHWLDPSLHHRDSAHTAVSRSPGRQGATLHAAPPQRLFCHSPCPEPDPLPISCHRASGGGRGDPTAAAHQERCSLCDPEAAQEPGARLLGRLWITQAASLLVRSSCGVSSSSSTGSVARNGQGVRLRTGAVTEEPLWRCRVKCGSLAPWAAGDGSVSTVPVMEAGVQPV